MKKIIAILMALTLLATACVLAGCNNHTDIQDDKLSVVTTIFPEYDWVKNILGDKADRAELTMLLDNGVDLHSYQPTVDDMVEISNCDLFYVGGESDGWVEDALKNPKNPNRKVINLLEVLGDAVKKEESVEGMEEHEHEHGHGDEELTAEDIKDRTLSDFAGEWKSLYPYLTRGELDAYCEHKAEEDGDDTTAKETYLEKYKASWQCDAVKIEVMAAPSHLLTRTGRPFPRPTPTLVAVIPITDGISKSRVGIRMGMRYFTTAFEKRILKQSPFVIAFILHYPE